MSSRPLLTYEFKDKDGNTKIMVKEKDKLPGSKQSEVSFFLARIFVPIILTFVLCLFKQGILFAVVMWIFVIAKIVYDYREIYPPLRPATEEEIRTHYFMKKYKAYQVWKEYRYRTLNYDIYGGYKDSFCKYSDQIAIFMGIYPEKHSDSFVYSKDSDVLPESVEKRLPEYHMIFKEKELALRRELEEKLAEAEKKFGANWIEEFEKEYGDGLR